MRLIDADTVVHWQSYDDEHETFPDHEGTIAEFLDSMTDEGCPDSADAAPVVHGRWIGDANSLRCSVCNRDLMDYFSYTEDGQIVIHPDFCPNCRADMRKDGERHD